MMAQRPKGAAAVPGAPVAAAAEPAADEGQMRFSGFLAVLLAALFAGSATAGTFPRQPITLIAPQAPGSGSDQIARALAPHIAAALGGGVEVEVVNRGGAAGEAAFTLLAEAPPDGHTIGLVHTPHFLSMPIERQTRFDPERIDPLVNLVEDAYSLAVPDGSPFRTLRDLLTHAEGNPAGLSVGTSGIGSGDHLALLMMQRRAMVRFNHVPFPGPQPSQRALLSSTVEAGALKLGDAVRQRKAGAVRILVQSGDERSGIAADVPTFREERIDLAVSVMVGVAAPAGLPPDVRERLVAAILRAADDGGFRSRVADLGMPVRVLPPDAFAARLRAMSADLRALWAESPWLR